jgi:hypothetical protein
LIRHADTGPALPICALAAPVGIFALFCLLVTLVCCPSLPLARSVAARLAAIALTSVARAANHEDQMAVRPQAMPGTKQTFGL